MDSHYDMLTVLQRELKKALEWAVIVRMTCAVKLPPTQRRPRTRASGGGAPRAVRNEDYSARTAAAIASAFPVTT